MTFWEKEKIQGRCKKVMLIETQECTREKRCSTRKRDKETKKPWIENLKRNYKNIFSLHQQSKIPFWRLQYRTTESLVFTWEFIPSFLGVIRTADLFAFEIFKRNFESITDQSRKGTDDHQVNRLTNKEFERLSITTTESH